MVKRYEPYHRFYAYEDEPSLEMRESACGEYVRLETFKHEMQRMQAQVDRLKAKLAKFEEAMPEGSTLEIIQLGTREKSPEDWRAFLYFTRVGFGEEIELRGYGKTKDEASQQVLDRYYDKEYIAYICDDFNLPIKYKG
jgi:hypothetical protein